MAAVKRSRLPAPCSVWSGFSSVIVIPASRGLAKRLLSALKSVVVGETLVASRVLREGHVREIDDIDIEMHSEQSVAAILDERSRSTGCLLRVGGNFVDRGSARWRGCR